MAINDKIWKFLLKIFCNYTDNVAIIILCCGILFSFVFSFCYVYIFRRHIGCFFLNIPYVASVSYMIYRLPVLHPKIYLALKNTASVILQSAEYQKAFQKISGLRKLTSQSIAEYLYETTEDFTGTVPVPLYSSLSRVLNKSRCIFGPFDVHGKGLPAALLILTVCLVLFYSCYLHGKRKAWPFLILITGSGFVNYGTLLCSIWLCILEYIYISFFTNCRYCKTKRRKRKHDKNIKLLQNAQRNM